MPNDFWKGRKTLVTGATGFLGSWLCAKLVDVGADVVILQRDVPKDSMLLTSGTSSGVSIARGELESYYDVERTMNEYEIDTCFHIGAQAIVGTANRSPISTFKSNIEGTWNILESARNSKLLKRLVIASSDKAYGSHAKLPYSENAELKADHPYDVSKTCADLIARSYYVTYGIPLGITRCGNFYGGGDLNFNRLIPGTVMSILGNQDIIIRSDGKYLRDYLYIKDAVSAYMTLAENLHRKEVGGEAFNFGTENPLSVIDVVNKITKISGNVKSKVRILNEATNEIREQYLSSKKANTILKWKNNYNIDSGLKETYEWYKAYANGKAKGGKL